MTDGFLMSELLAKWTASEKIRQERLYAATVAEEALLLIMMEEQMARERLEQRFRHEHALLKLSLTGVVTTHSHPATLHEDTPWEICAENLDSGDPLPFDVVDQLTEEEVEHIWQQEKRRLQQRILSLNNRVQKLLS